MPNRHSDIRTAEKRVCNHLLSKLGKPNKYLAHPNGLEPGVVEAVRLLSKTFPDYSDAIWIGGNHSERGDIIIKSPSSGRVAIELKFPTKDFTTLANLGQWFVGVLTDNKVEPYPDFVKRCGGFVQKLKVVSLPVSSSNKDFINRCREIRKKKGVKRFGDTIEGAAIHAIDESNKKEFMRLIFNNLTKNGKLDPVCSALERGLHTKGAIESFILSANNNYNTSNSYYLLKVENSISQTRAIASIEDMTDRSSLVKGVDLGLSGLALKLETYEGHSFEFRLHWKNVGQGVATPAFMVWRFE